MAKDNLTLNKIRMLVKNIRDFDEIDIQLEEKLQEKLQKILDESFMILKKELSKLREIPDDHGYINKRTRQIVKVAVDKFDEHWQRESLKVLLPEIRSSVSRGILQSRSLIANSVKEVDNAKS